VKSLDNIFHVNFKRDYTFSVIAAISPSGENFFNSETDTGGFSHNTHMLINGCRKSVLRRISKPFYAFIYLDEG
jgi:hypothetical protein